MSSKSKSKQAEALQLLDDLDSFTPIEAPPQESASNGGTAQTVPRTSTPSTRRPAVSSNNANTGSNGGDTAEALAFLDEIQQKATEPISRPSSSVHNISRSGTPTLRKSTERVKLGGGTPTSLLPGASASSTSLHRQLSSSSPTASDSGAKKAAEQTPAASGSSGSGGGWGWGSVWSTASAAIQQARTVVDEQVKNLPQVQIPNNEQAKKWREGVLEYAKNAQLDKLGMPTLLVCQELLVKADSVRPGLQASRIVHVDRHSECCRATYIRA